MTSVMQRVVKLCNSRGIIRELLPPIFYLLNKSARHAGQAPISFPGSFKRKLVPVHRLSHPHVCLAIDVSLCLSEEEKLSFPDQCRFLRKFHVISHPDFSRFTKFPENSKFSQLLNILVRAIMTMKFIRCFWAQFLSVAFGMGLTASTGPYAQKSNFFSLWKELQHCSIRYCKVLQTASFISFSYFNMYSFSHLMSHSWTNITGRSWLFISTWEAWMLHFSENSSMHFLE